MVQLDYVTTKCDRFKKKGWNISLCILISVALFLILAISLYSFSKKPLSVKKIPEEKSEIFIPKKLRERWAYLEQLKNPNDRVVQSPLEAASPTTINEILTNNGSPITHHKSVLKKIENSAALKIIDRWVVQCGAFRDRQNAEFLKAQIAMAGLNSYIQQDTLYRVLIGTHHNKRQAEKMVSRLKQSAITNCIVTKK